MPGIMEVMNKMLIGCLGALTPILVSLITVDLHTTLAGVTWIEAGFYSLRLVGLCIAACVVIFLNSDEVRPVKLFQLGIAAPALLTTLINGTAATQNGRRVDLEFPTFIGSVLAQGIQPSESDGSIAQNCVRPPDASVSQQVLKGLVGILPDNQWFVVVGSYSSPEGARADVAEISRSFASKFEAKICAPLGGLDNRYRVIVGSNLSYADATKLKIEAISAGLSRDSWLWNPTDTKKGLLQ